jgi:two-component system, LytTR family, response regulator
MSLSVLIIDDEPLARAFVRKMCDRHNDINILGECENGIKAIAEIESLRPDLVFLDVQMPEVDGFDVLSALDPEAIPQVIFVTAYDRYAVKAFEFHALDYILKPFDQERIDAALDRARKQVINESRELLSERVLALLSSQKQDYLNRVIIKNAGRVFFVKLDEVDWVEAEGNYVALHTGKQKHLFRSPIKSFELQLDPAKFRRIHRSTIVNIDKIKELQAWFRGDYKVVLTDGTELRLSQRFRENLDRDFGGTL